MAHKEERLKVFPVWQNYVRSVAEIMRLARAILIRSRNIAVKMPDIIKEQESEPNKHASN